MEDFEKEEAHLKVELLACSASKSKLKKKNINFVGTMISKSFYVIYPSVEISI